MKRQICDTTSPSTMNEEQFRQDMEYLRDRLDELIDAQGELKKMLKGVVAKFDEMESEFEH